MCVRLLRRVKQNDLVNTLVNLKGNARACVYTEPLWGIPTSLYTPFVSMYMSALGVSDPGIGLIGTIFLISQVVFALMSGALTDKLGRRNCTLWFDIIAWSIPTLLWAFAQNQVWLLFAAFFNGVYRVTANSWNMLLVEDVEERILVKLFALVSVAGSLAAFTAPLAAPLVARFGLIPTVRVMYIIAFVMMTAKFITGAEPLSNWDAYVKTVESMGISEVLGVYQNAYDRLNVTISEMK